MKITIDKEAVRFYYDTGGKNLFWCDLFRGTKQGKTFQDELMEALFVAYNECVIKNICPTPDEMEDK